MSLIEKLFVQIFEKKDRIVDHANRQCHLFDQHLVSKLLIDGIVPPPWLANPVFPSLTSDPKGLNEDDLIFEALFSRPQSTIPFSGRHCSLHGNVATTDDAQAQSGLHNDFHALEKGSDAGDWLSNLPDCSVNNVGRCSTSAPEVDSASLSPQFQMESKISHSYNDPALSLAKLQRSKSRQRALELRHSAKAAKTCSRDDNNAGVCTSRITGSATSSLQLDHIEGSDLVKDFDTDIPSSAPEEEDRGDCLTENNGQPNYAGRITRSKSLALKHNSLNVVSSSVVKEDDLKSNKGIDSFETVDPPCFLNESCGAKEMDTGDYQRRESESNVYQKRLTRSRSTSQPKCDNELLKLDTTLVRGNEVGIHDHMQSLADIDFLSNAFDHTNESERKTIEDGDCRMTVGSLKSMCNSIKSPQPPSLQHSQAPVVPSDGSFLSQKDPDLCALKENEVKNIDGISKHVSYGVCDRSSTHSKSAASDKSLILQDTEMAAERSSSSKKDCKLNTEMAISSVVVASVAACRNTGAVTTCTTEWSLEPVNSSDLDGRESRHTRSTSKKSLLAKSLPVETVVAEKPLDTRENIISGANVTGIVEDRSAAIVKVDANLEGLVEKHIACLGSSPKVRLDVSFSRPPSDFVMSVKPKQLDFDDVEELSMCEISSPDLKVEGNDMQPENGTSLVFRDNCNFSPEILLPGRQEIMVREDGPQTKSCESHLKEADAAKKTVNVMSSKTELSVVQKELGTHTSFDSQELPIGPSSSMNHLSSSQVACENSSGSFPKDIIASKLISEASYLENDECSSKLLENAISAAVTGNGLLGNEVQNVTDLTVEFPSAAHTDELNVALTQQVPSSGNCLYQNNNLSRGKVLSDEKDAGFSTEFPIEKNLKGSFASDMEHSCPQQKRRKIESQAERSLPASPSLSEKPHESSNQRFVSGNLNIKEHNPEADSEIENLTYHGDIPNLYEGDGPTEEIENTEGCYLEKGSSPEVRLDKKFNKDERDRSVSTVLTFTSNELGESRVSCLTEQGSGNSHNCLTGQMVVANSSGSDIGSTRRCTVGKNLDSWHAERSNSRKRIYPGENAKLSDGSSVSLGIQSSDMIGMDETRPVIERFIIQPDEARPSTGDDHIELEKLNFPSDTIEYSSILEHLGMSAFMHSPLCYSSTPYRLHKVSGLHQSLPNGFGEGVGSSIPLNESGKSLSDCLPNWKDQSTRDVKKTCASPIQNLWEKINSKFGSSGKRESLKPELPCIDEENEAADETDNTFQKGIGPEVMPSSIRREPLADITDNANPSSVSQDDILGERRDQDSVAREFSFGVTHDQVKQKLEKEDAGRRFTGKGKENKSISCGASRAKRTRESARNRSSRPKLSGKNSMKNGPNHSVGKSACSNIISNITSFIPLVQQKQAAEVITGKRDIKVKALEAAEAAKRMAEKKENERKMKKEALRLKREILEQNNLKQLELQNIKKEEERKKKEAEMAAKKRQREEEEEVRKRKRVEEAKRKHQEHERKCAKKENKETKCRAAGEGKLESEECIDARGKCKNFENNREGNTKIPSSEPLAIKNPTNDKTKESLKHSEAVNESNTGKVIGKTIKATEDDDLIVQNIVQEESYDISPYKGSDDEDEDDDDNKFIPSWASKHRLSLAVSSQKVVDPETVFPLQSFCSIAEALLPRKLQVK
ncbi:uncharacterized protein G2W53_025899 [Senna tora]|uniref:Inner centromere protein ARK-binding domain-containing protein n=1 Tax=Senna tora TaxID=362788 RepID=A0A834WKR0_9FABA|nr:uncharacterized protein G2W53_025899 [Senna tora]